MKYKEKNKLKNIKNYESSLVEMINIDGRNIPIINPDEPLYQARVDSSFSYLLS